MNTPDLPLGSNDAIERHESSHHHLPAVDTVTDHAAAKGYSVLVDIQYPFGGPIGAFKYIENPSVEGVLRLISQIMAVHGYSQPGIPIKALRVRKGNNAYDILDYTHGDIGDLLEEVRKLHKIATIRCVYGFREGGH